MSRRLTIASEEELADRSPLVVSSPATHGSIVADRVCIVSKLKGDVRDVSAVFRTGEVHCICSVQEKGASLLVHALAGIENVSSGIILASGFPVVSTKFRRCMGFVSRKGMCIPDATVEENLLLSLRMKVSDRAGNAAVIESVSSFLNIDSMLRCEVRTLAPATRKLVDVAMELVTNPQFIFLDSPLENVSSAEHQPLLDAIKKLRKSGKCVIFSAPRVSFGLLEVADTLLMLDTSGRMIASGEKNFCASIVSSTVGGHGDPLSLVEDIGEWASQTNVDAVRSAFARSVVGRELEAAVKRSKERNTATVLNDVNDPSPNMFSRIASLVHFTARHAVFRIDFLMAWGAMLVSFLLCVALAQRQVHDQMGMQNKRGILFFIFSCVTHINLLFVDSEAIDRDVIFYLRNGGYFSTMTCFFTTVIRLGAPRVIFSIISLIMAKLLFQNGDVAVLLGLTSFAHSVGVTLATSFISSPRDVAVALLVYYGYSTVFSGFLITSTTVPGVLTQLSILRPGYGASVAAMLRGLPYSCDAISSNKTLSYCYTGDTYLQIQGFSEDTIDTAAMELFLTALALLVVLFVRMLFS